MTTSSAFGKRAGIRVVAERAGVAVSSVSRVLSAHPNVSSEMRERVMAAVGEVGYSPNRLAQGLRSGASTSIGFVVGDISNPLMSTIALAAEMRLAQEGYALLLANSHNLPERDIANVRLFEQRSVDGLLLSLSDEDNSDALAQLGEFHKPTVLLDRDPNFHGASRVLFDHRLGFGSAMRHLAELGHRRIAFLGGSPHVRPTRERLAAVLAEASSARIPRPTIRLGVDGRSQAHAKTVKLLRGNERPTAIISAGNQFLSGVISAINELGFRIPDDVSLVTADANDLTELHCPSISFVGRDPGLFGRAAAESLLRQLDGEPPDVVTLPTSFVERSSCARPQV